MKNIRAFHTLCSKPAFENSNYNMQDHAILTMILSALKWKQNMGSIKLIADEKVISYLTEKNLDVIWDEIEILEELDINYKMFWAGCKIFTLKKQKLPIVMLDVDMIVWNDISSKLNSEVIAIHDEPLIEDIYRDKNYFKLNSNYSFDDDFDWSVKASNTALLYIQNEEFRDYYCDESIKFMENAQNTDDTLSYMIFAEQRLLPMCAKKQGKKIKHLLKYPQAIGNQNDFTHIWGYKRSLSMSEDENEIFCKRCVSRILKDFPRESMLFLKNEFFYKYM